MKAIYSGADMTKPAEIAEMIKTTEKTFGSVDVLVNNAGIQFVAKVEDFPIEKWDAVIATNLSAAFHTDARRDARHEGAQVGPHHQHRLRARAGRERREGRLRGGEARHRRPHQGGGDRGRE